MLTPDRVLELLRQGNARFTRGERLHDDFLPHVEATAAQQQPMVAVLSCIDSRAPAELIFDQGIGDLLNVRLAGNVGSPKALGSLEFGCKVAGARLVLVMGHTRCGAVSAACDFVSRGVDPVEATGMSHIGSIIEPIAEAVRMETATTGDRTSGNPEFVDRVARIHVHRTMKWILQNSATLREMAGSGEIAIAGAIYDVRCGRVEFLGAAADGSGVRIC